MVKNKKQLLCMRNLYVQDIIFSPSQDDLIHEKEALLPIKSLNKYFARPVLQMVVNQPLDIIKGENEYDINATVKGGGLSGQAGALRHGISKALSLYDIGFRPVLKKIGFLTRDPRVVERKKYGKAKARKSYQFSKR